MKKSLYFVICFIVMFGYCGEVNGVDLCSRDNPGDGSNLVIKYKNICANNGSTTTSNSCGSTNGVSVDGDTILVQIDKNTGNQFSDDCYKEMQSKFRVLVLIDDSYSMLETDKNYVEVKNGLRQFKGKISSNFQIKLCYFSSGCLNGGWIRNGNNFLEVVGEIDHQRNSDGSVIGVNTNFNFAFDKAIDEFSKSSDYIPVVLFITDGYPTKENSTSALGYLSSSRYAISALEKLKNMRNKINQESVTNPYVTNNAMIFTVGLGLNKDDSFAKYLLNPNNTTFTNLNNSSNILESKNLYNLLNGNGNKSVNYMVAGVASFPDKGLIRNTYARAKKDGSKYKHVIKFDAGADKGMPFSNVDNALIKDHGVMFAALKKTSSNKCRAATDIRIQYKYNGSTVTISSSDITVMDGNDGDGGFAGYEDYCFYVVKPSSNIADFKKASMYKFIFWGSSSNDNASLLSDSTDKNYTKYDGIVTSFFTTKVKDFSNNLKNMVINQISIKDHTPSKNFIEETNVTESRYSNCSKKNIRTLDGNYYIRDNGQLKKLDNLSVEYIITQEASFDGGSLKDEFLTYAGGGFPVNGVSVANKIRWYYSQYEDSEGSSNPVFIAKLGNKEFYKDLSNLYDANGNKINISTMNTKVWQEIRNNIIDASLGETLKTVDSNDNKNKNIKSPIPVDISVEGSNNDVAPTKSGTNDINSIFTKTYTLAGKQAYLDENNKFSYDSNCKTSRGESCFKFDNGDYYYLPYNISEGTVYIWVNGNFSSISGINLNFEDECKVEVSTRGTPSKVVSYRSIDVNVPFPKAGDSYDKIPFNWREWYCSSVNNNICYINSNNSARLSNSYNKIYYSISLSEDDISKINQDTLDNNSYMNFSGINSNGVSNFVNDNFSTKSIVADKSFCERGKFSTECDIYGR